jgi:hypothetical protein
VSKALAKIGKVAGIVASVAALIPGGQPIALIASAVAVTANVGAAITAKKPPAKGAANSITIGTDQPTPGLIGRTYYGGARQHQVGYGPTIKDVPNPYLLMVDVYSGAGPLAGLDQLLFDFEPVGTGGAIGGYFNGFAWAAVQSGAVPEATALQPHWPGAPGWGAAYGLSGKAAVAWSLLFDRKGKVFASGAPQTGAIWRGQLCYDPRKDSSYPGGSGMHRWADPRDTAAHDAARATWEYSEDPGLHALNYALGRYHRDPRVGGSTYTKVFGCGIPIDGLIVDDFVHLANVCDANGWACGGVIFEPGNRWTNLKDILTAGGAQPAWVGGRLGLKVSAPRVALDTITSDDLADDDITVSAMQGWEDRLNTLIPKVRSEAHKWEYVQATTPVSIPSQVAEDGEEKKAERQFNLCQDFDQGAQLCAYELLDGRELGDIVLTVKPRLRRYGAGDLLIVDLPEAGLVAQPCVVLKRTLDPATMTVQFVLRGETAAKHDFALGRTGTAPATPAIPGTAGHDGVATALINGTDVQSAIATSFPIGLAITASDDGTIVLSDHVRRYTDGHADVAVTGVTIASALAPGAFRAIGYDDGDRLGGAVAFQLFEDDLDARVSPDHSGRHYVGYAVIPTAGSPPSDGGGASPPGGNCVTTDTPVMMADGSEKQAGDIVAGDMLMTRHEDRLLAIGGGWGSFPVEAITIADSDDVWRATIGGRVLRATGDHLVYTGSWVAMRTIGEPDGSGSIVKLTVTGAHTYVSNGILSHNIKQLQ